MLCSEVVVVNRCGSYILFLIWRRPTWKEQNYIDPHINDTKNDQLKFLYIERALITSMTL